MIFLPSDFKMAMERQLSEDARTFFDAVSEESPVSVRLHPYKGTASSLKNSSPMPWSSGGRYLAYRPSFTLDPAFHGGAYYVQEASSMFLEHVLKQLYSSRFSSDFLALDLCASPGGKTSILAESLDHCGSLIANEVISSRQGPLIENTMKWAYKNTVVTQNDAADFQALGENIFDLILVDAPCSGEGMFRKDKRAVEEWSLDHVKMCSLRQKRIVRDIHPCLREGGYLIYSTCTYNERENMDNVVSFCRDLGYETAQIHTNPAWGITEVEKDGSIGYQFYPHRVQGEGFFLSVLTKQKRSGNQRSLAEEKVPAVGKAQHKVLGEWFSFEADEIFLHPAGDVYWYNAATRKRLNHLIKKLRVRYSGVKAGHINRSVFVPDHALSLVFNEHLLTTDYAVNENEALAFLAKKDLSADGMPKGWLRLTYNEIGIGWVKNIGPRVNNYLPKNLRIRMDVPE